MECNYYFVDGTWNVPTTLWTAHGMCLLLCGRYIECAYFFAIFSCLSLGGRQIRMRLYQRLPKR